VKNIDHMISTN